MGLSLLLISIYLLDKFLSIDHLEIFKWLNHILSWSTCQSSERQIIPKKQLLLRFTWSCSCSSGLNIFFVAIRSVYGLMKNGASLNFISIGSNSIMALRFSFALASIGVTFSDSSLFDLLSGLSRSYSMSHKGFSSERLVLNF